LDLVFEVLSQLSATNSNFFPAYTSSNDSEVSEQLYNEMKPAVEGANYIVKHMHDKNDYNEV